MQKLRALAYRWVASLGTEHDREYLLENLSVLIASGMSVIEVLEAIKADMRSTWMREQIEHIEANIEAGQSLWHALESSHMFPTHAISLIKVGEESGRLVDNLRVVALEQEKDRIFRSKIRSAMMYPIFVLSLTFTIGIGIAWFILPKLATVFAQLKVELPLITKILIGLGAFLGAYGAIVMPIVIGLVGSLVYILFFRAQTRYIGQNFLFLFPGIHRLIQELELARFGYLLGILLQAGIPITQALDSLVNASYFPGYRRLYEHMRTRIEEGNSFQKSFASFPGIGKLMPTSVQQLIVAGEKSGSLPETLLKVSATYEAKTDTTTKDLTIILEPVLLVIVWLGVVAVALAVILPIYSLIGGLSVN